MMTLLVFWENLKKLYVCGVCVCVCVRVVCIIHINIYTIYI